MKNTETAISPTTAFILSILLCQILLQPQDRRAAGSQINIKKKKITIVTNQMQSPATWFTSTQRAKPRQRWYLAWALSAGRKRALHSHGESEQNLKHKTPKGCSGFLVFNQRVPSNLSIQTNYTYYCILWIIDNRSHIHSYYECIAVLKLNLKQSVKIQTLS